MTLTEISETKDYLKNPSRHKLFWFGAFIILYRFYILLRYNIHWTDVDQILMWYGAKLFSTLTFPEPCFFGQPYGSMADSLVAVPLVWLKVPYYIALPLASHFITAFPFFYIARKLSKKGKNSEAFFALVLYFCMGWKWDLLASVPRGITGGLLLSVIGGIIMNEEGSNSRRFLGAFLAAFGAVITNSAGALAVVAYLYFMMNIKQNKKALSAVFWGGITAVVFFIMIKNFYEINSDFALFGKYRTNWFSYKFLGRNMLVMADLLGTFLFLQPVKAGGVIFFLLNAAAIIYLVKSGQKKIALLYITSIIVFLVFCSYRKSREFDESFLFSQERMFLFIPYLLLLIFYFWSKEGNLLNNTILKKLADKNILIFSILVSVTVIKILSLEFELNDKNSSLYISGACQTCRPSVVIEDARTELTFAEENNCDVIIVKDGSASITYAMDAFADNNKITVYHTRLYRPAWSYHKLQHIKPHKVLCIDYEKKTHEIFEIKDTSVIRWLADNWEHVRNVYKNDDLVNPKSSLIKW